jgi:hypothetical protein
MKARAKVRCAGCNKRISQGEPDFILRRMSEENPTVSALRLVYHVRCHGAALERTVGTPALWHLTHRYIDAEAN